MRFYTSLLVVIAPALLLGLACEETVRPPPPPADASRHDGTVVPPPTMGRDSGADTGVDGAITDGAVDGDVDGAVDAALPLGCFPAGVGTDTDAVLMSGTETYPFSVNRSFVTWDPLCPVEPALLIGLTDGTCSPLEASRSGRSRLIFSVDLTSIGTSVQAGTPVDISESAGIGLDVRFSVTSIGGTTTQEWGNCAGSGGTVTFSSLEDTAGSNVTADFDMVLSDCSGGAMEPLSVQGSFDMIVERSLESVCM